MRIILSAVVLERGGEGGVADAGCAVHVEGSNWEVIKTLTLQYG